jgi:ceramide glucosyltransferase
MFADILLAVWSGAGLIWWLAAWHLVMTKKRKQALEPVTTLPRALSIFKPLPFLGATGLDLVSVGVESFVAQLDAESEMLLGIHEADRSATAAFVDRLKTAYPHARLKVIFRSKPDDVANPKIAWQKILARHAEGELWLWSDADIVAPSGFLQYARLEYAHHEIPSAPALLEALFVNVEFYPGVLLLRQLGPVDFGLGAAMLFQRDDFFQKVDWSEIGSRLADDFYLGQTLGPVRVGQTTLATVAGAFTWPDALRHDLRWAKTIRWNQPMGSFSRLLIMPVLGWIGVVALHPSHFFTWMGLLGMIQAEVFFAAAICRGAGCHLKPRDWLFTQVWCLWRVILWCLCWLPGPVQWSGSRWLGPKAELNHEIELRRA